MLILTSPAKTLDYQSKLPAHKSTTPLFLKEANSIVTKLAKLTERQLKKTLGVSNKIATLNFQRLQKWSITHTTNNSRASIFAYKGDIYRELSAYKYNKTQLEYAQKSLRIISGLYGIIRPLDLIMPYRLEMETEIKVNSSSNLYNFWGDKLTKYLSDEISKNNHRLMINLASKEYSNAIDFNKLNTQVIHIQFLQTLRGKTKNYGLLTKRARGMMIEYLITNQTEKLEDIKKFHTKGYKFTKETPSTLTFTQY